jgi:hypothetical protein
MGEMQKTLIDHIENESCAYQQYIKKKSLLSITYDNQVSLKEIKTEYVYKYEQNFVLNKNL